MDHKWISISETHDQCLRCGVAAPDCGDDHGSLPWGCEGTGVASPHWFERTAPWSGVYVGDDGITLHAYAGWRIACEHCGHAISEYTRPSEVQWECTA